MLIIIKTFIFWDQIGSNRGDKSQNFHIQIGLLKLGSLNCLQCQFLLKLHYFWILGLSQIYWVAWVLQCSWEYFFGLFQLFFKKGGFGWFYNKSGWFWVISGGSNSFWGVPYFSMYLNDLTTFEFMSPLILWILFYSFLELF